MIRVSLINHSTNLLFFKTILYRTQSWIIVSSVLFCGDKVQKTRNWNYWKKKIIRWLEAWLVSIVFSIVRDTHWCLLYHSHLVLQSTLLHAITIHPILYYLYITWFITCDHFSSFWQKKMRSSVFSVLWA